MLEERYAAIGKVELRTTDFSFNHGDDTIYEVKFVNMFQKHGKVEEYEHPRQGSVL